MRRHSDASQRQIFFNAFLTPEQFSVDKIIYAFDRAGLPIMNDCVNVILGASVNVCTVLPWYYIVGVVTSVILYL